MVGAARQPGGDRQTEPGRLHGGRCQQPVRRGPASVRRGYLARIHAKMRRTVQAAGGRIDRIAYCPHHPEAGCECRKPAPGLLHRLAGHYGVPLAGVPVIGDSRRDLEAARAAGARPILVRTGNGTRTEAAGEAGGVEVYDDLAAAADVLAEER